MTNERHEKALEAAMQGSPVVSRFTIESAISAYLAAMDAVIVPKEPTKEMEIAARIRVRPFHDISEKEWRSKMPGDLFRIGYKAMISNVPNHFTNGE
jgi:hypothetical protein